MSSPNENTFSATWVVPYSSFGTDKNLLADGPPTIGDRWPCRRIVPGSTGNLVIVQPDGTSRTLPVTAGEVIDQQAIQITASGTTVTSAKVYW